MQADERSLLLTCVSNNTWAESESMAWRMPQCCSGAADYGRTRAQFSPGIVEASIKE